MTMYRAKAEIKRRLNLAKYVTLAIRGGYKFGSPADALARGIREALDPTKMPKFPERKDIPKVPICPPPPIRTLPAGQLAKKLPSQVSTLEAQELVRAIGRLGRKREAFAWKDKLTFSPKFIAKLQRLVLEGIQFKRKQKW